MVSGNLGLAQVAEMYVKKVHRLSCNDAGFYDAQLLMDWDVWAVCFPFPKHLKSRL